MCEYNLDQLIEIHQDMVSLIPGPSVPIDLDRVSQTLSASRYRHRLPSDYLYFMNQARFVPYGWELHGFTRDSMSLEKANSNIDTDWTQKEYDRYTWFASSGDDDDFYYFDHNIEADRSGPAIVSRCWTSPLYHMADSFTSFLFNQTLVVVEANLRSTVVDPNWQSLEDRLALV